MKLSFVEIAGEGKKAVERGVDSVEVQIMQKDSLVRESITDSSGVCMFRFLKPGRYDIVAKKPGKETIRTTGVIVAADKVTYCPAKMTPFVASKDKKGVKLKKVKG